jgi:hypothetical protein
MKIEIFSYDAVILTPLSIRYDKYRRPKTGLLCAADR